MFETSLRNAQQYVIGATLFNYLIKRLNAPVLCTIARYRGHFLSSDRWI